MSTEKINRTDSKGVVMETFIRGLAALGIALAVAAFAWSQPPAAPPGVLPPPQPAPPGYGPYPGGPVAGQDNGTGWAPFMENYFQRRDANVGGGHLGKTNRGVQFPAKRLHSKKEKWSGGPTTQPGTLVFPQHPFARSPRDFFMID
jgi:hypothetical protein